MKKNGFKYRTLAVRAASKRLFLPHGVEPEEYTLCLKPSGKIGSKP